MGTWVKQLAKTNGPKVSNRQSRKTEISIVQKLIAKWAQSIKQAVKKNRDIDSDNEQEPKRGWRSERYK